MKKALVGILTLGLIMGLIRSSIGMGQKTLGTPQTNVSTTTIVNTEQELEEYIPKIIIEGKWGKGEDEYYQVPKNFSLSLPMYRYSFDIDSQGNIYILVGYKILKYEENGKWIKTVNIEPPIFGNDIRVASDGNIFIIFSPWQQPENVVKPEDYTSEGIRVYDKSLQFKAIYKIKIRNFSGYMLYKDNSGDIWYEDRQYRYPFYVRNEIYEEAERLKFAQQRRSESKDKKYHYVLSPKKDFFEILDNNDKSLKKVPIKIDFLASRGDFLSADDDNLYFDFKSPFYENHEVHKYDLNGNLKHRIKMKPPYFERELCKLCYAPVRPVVIDKFGNIYQLYISDSEGVKIIKWERVKK